MPSSSQQRPEDAGLLMNLGMARYMAGDAAGAVEPLEKAVKLSPGLGPASLFLGSALVDLGRVDEAIVALRRAVAALPKNADAREMLARACLAESKFAEAAKEFRELTRLQPDSPGAWYGLTRSYEGIAEHALDALQTEAPESPLLELVVADVAVTQDKFPAALAIYRRVMAGTPPVGGLHEAVAELYERAGHADWAAAERVKATRSAGHVHGEAPPSAISSPAATWSRSTRRCLRRRRRTGTGRSGPRIASPPRRSTTSTPCRSRSNCTSSAPRSRSPASRTRSRSARSAPRSP